jgi:large subunit ribosomal protein L29
MELTKIRSLNDEELKHQETTSSEQLFRIRFQVALGQNDGVKKLRQLRKEIAQIKTVARERELGIHTEAGEEKPAAKAKTATAKEAAPTAETKAEKPHAAAHAVKAKTKAARKAAPKSGSAAKTKTGKTKKAAPKAKSSAKKKTGKAKGASK